MRKIKKEESFFASVIHIGTGTIVNMAIGFFSTPIITRLVVPEEYGRLSIFTLYISIAIMILCLGLDQALVRYYYHHSEISYKNWLLTRCLGIPIILTLLASIIFVVLVKLIKIPFDFADILLVFCIGIVAEVLYRFASLNLRLNGYGKKYAASSVIYKSVYVIVAILMINLTGDKSFRFLAIGTVAGYVLASLYAIVNCREQWKPVFHGTYEVKTGELFKYGIPFIMSLGLTTLFSAIDKLSLKALCDYSTVGIYASALNLVHVFAIIQTSFNAVWAPIAVKHYEENPEDRSFYTKYNSIITVSMFSFGAFFILFKDVFGMLLGPKYQDCAQILPFLAMQPIMYSISETTITGVVVKKKSYVHIIVAIVSCLVNICGNLILVPQFGARGAAISTGVSYIVFYALRTYFGDKYYKFEHGNSKFWCMTILMLIYTAFNTFFSDWIVSLALCIMILVTVYMFYKGTIESILNDMKRKF